ncbi:Pkinase-domain-containing protein [Mycena indigotica]|uniref:non-specific serine/threonine protein kinase n=1 Tax=Mycena indigotica TaxID=2126181 RepID=A0A8H6RY30_9AGAR|nr:Pkinase-domain-containing protein [Mycena indigotica]KAF7289880.1 Pkinase-domain-containing protein [Mycena indigotica]
MPASRKLPNLTGLIVDCGRLRIDEQIGAGSFGTVYRASQIREPFDPRLPKTVAVKCLGERSFYTDKEHSMHYVCSSHPSVLTFYGQFSVMEGNVEIVCFILELCKHNLWTPITWGTFDYDNDAVKRAFSQILDGVQSCHERGIYHRDLKPENVLCHSSDPQVMLADFGMAIRNPNSNTASGTLPYLSPEALSVALRDGSATYSAAQNDIWACAVILVNMVTARYPWRQATSSDPAWSAFLLDQKHFLSRKFPIISSEFNRLLVRCFNPEPAERPSLAEMQASILGMHDFFRDPPSLSVPVASASSAPTTPGASFSFEDSRSQSTKPSALDSADYSLLRELAGDDKPLSVASRQQESKHSYILPADHPTVLALPSADQRLLARLRARPRPRIVRFWSTRHVTPIAPRPPPKVLNPAQRLCRWVCKQIKAPLVGRSLASSRSAGSPGC